jgi:hypothetical protein
MAKIQEEIIVIRLSKLVKESISETETLTDLDFNANVEALVQELVGPAVVVEIANEL